MVSAMSSFKILSRAGRLASGWSFGPEGEEGSSSGRFWVTTGVSVGVSAIVLVRDDSVRRMLYQKSDYANARSLLLLLVCLLLLRTKAANVEECVRVRVIECRIGVWGAVLCCAGAGLGVVKNGAAVMARGVRCNAGDRIWAAAVERNAHSAREMRMQNDKEVLL